MEGSSTMRVSGGILGIEGFGGVIAGKWLAVSWKILLEGASLMKLAVRLHGCPE
jgi:hypothetical protein